MWTEFWTKLRRSVEFRPLWKRLDVDQSRSRERAREIELLLRITRCDQIWHDKPTMGESFQEVDCHHATPPRGHQQGNSSFEKAIRSPVLFWLSLCPSSFRQLLDPLMSEFHFQGKTWLVLSLRTSGDWKTFLLEYCMAFLSHQVPYSVQFEGGGRYTLVGTRRQDFFNRYLAHSAQRRWRLC